MDSKLFSALFIAFLPSVVLAITGALVTVRKYGVFLWILRLDPIREKIVLMLREMQSPVAVAPDPEIAQHEPSTAVRVAASRDRSPPLPCAQPWLG